MCGIALFSIWETIPTTSDGALSSATVEVNDSRLLFKSSVTSSNIISNSTKMTKTAEQHKVMMDHCIKESIKYRGPDLPYSHRYHTIQYSTRVPTSAYEDLNANTTATTTTTNLAMIQHYHGHEAIHPIGKILIPPEFTATTSHTTSSNDDRNEDEDNSSAAASLTLNMYASVLHMRGETLTPQPYITTTNHCNNDEYYKYCFCWNGECYSYHRHDNDNDDDELLVSTNTKNDMNAPASFDVATISNTEEKESDTKYVMNILSHTIQQCHNTTTINTTYHDSDNHNNNTEKGASSGTTSTSNKDFRMKMQEIEHLSLAKVLSQIHGEYSFILHCQPNPHHNCNQNRNNPHDQKNDSASDDKGCVYFGRDILGRRSLLMTKINNNNNPYQSFIVSSVGLVSSSTSSSSFCGKNNQPQTETETEKTNYKVINNPNDFHSTMLYEMEEIEAGRLFRLDLNTGILSYTLIPKTSNRFVVHNTIDNDHEHLSIMKASEKLHHVLDNAVRRRVIHIPSSSATSSTKTSILHSKNDDNCANVAVLFSGGLDSVVLAALCHNHVPIEEPIDLINVAFSSSSSNNNDASFNISPDRQAAILSYNEMKRLWPLRQWNFISVNISYDEVLQYEKTIFGLIYPLSSTMDFNIGTAFWFASRGKGWLLLHDDDKLELMSSIMKHSNHLRFASNENNSDSSCKQKREERSKTEKCTMRNCSRKPLDGCIFHACKFCCSCYQKPINYFLAGSARLCPVHNNILSQEGKVGKKNNQNMKQGEVESNNRVMMTSTAKVILVGIGADEQLAGYGRHRTLYNKGGYEALRQELRMEKDRLWTRNLGRDDRCISHHGKEARFPYLDEEVVNFLDALDVSQVCDMTKAQGEGDKMILRLVAKKLGVESCSGLVKRAIQFGSRIAKVSDVEKFGSSRKASGTAPLNLLLDE